MSAAASPEDVASAVAYLRTPVAIRERAETILDAGLAGELDHFSVHLEKLEEVARHVGAVTRRRYPDLDIPLHSRWAHFGAGGVDRVGKLKARLAAAAAGPEESVRAHLDLVVVSVLLDAGAGPDWKYREAATGLVFKRSEGLAVATYDAFVNGVFSSRPEEPLRVDAVGLSVLDEFALGKAMQVDEKNPMIGFAGRAELLHRLAATLRAAPEYFGGDGSRPGRLFDTLLHQTGRQPLEAEDLLRVVLEGLGPIWPGRIELDATNLGDVWRHPSAGGTGPGGGLVPFHKLSQWLVYSLLEPLAAGGLPIDGLGELTGLAEYRNGGLFVDHGVLESRYPDVTERVHDSGAPAIVEWRALTVALLERLRPVLAGRLGLDERGLSAAKLLEGGTWAAGREIAAERRPGGGPPLRVRSDGTVF